MFQRGRSTQNLLNLICTSKLIKNYLIQSNMGLLNVKQVDFEFVNKIYLQDHGIKNDGWEKQNLKTAHDKFGNWIYAEIPDKEIGNIVLPHYKHGGIEITPAQGGLLKDVYQNFRENQDFFKKGNSQFCERVEFQKKRILEGDIKSIFLSQEPLLSGLSYEGLKEFKGQITHLDGFHRLIALMDLIDEKKNDTKVIPSYIAVYLSFFDNPKYF